MKKMKSLKVKMPLIIISVVSVFIIIMIMITDIKASNSIKNTAYKGYQNTILGYASLIDNWFDDQLTISKTYSSSKEVITYLLNRTEESRNEALNNIKNLKSINKYVINIGIADTSGNIILDSDDDKLINKNIIDLNPDIKNKMSSGEDVIFGEDIKNLK